MVICLIALPIFAILGIFSLKYRQLAWEAFHCLFKTVQLKPCDTGIDQRIKSKYTAKLMWWPGLARAFYKYFTVLSWIFVILMLVSTYFTGLGVYNYEKYGNCNGPDSNAFCIFNVVKPNQEECSATGVKQTLYPDKVKIEGYPVRGDPNAKLTIVEYGCFSCPYTKEAEPVVRQILQDYHDVNLVYHDVPLSIHKYSIEAAEAALCAKDQDKYWAYHDILFDKQNLLNDTVFYDFAQELNLNVTQFKECYSTKKYEAEINQSYANALDVGIYGTPTFFIKQANLVGPQKYKTFKAIIEDNLG